MGKKFKQYGNCGYLSLSNSRVVRTHEHSDTILFDYAADGELVGVEFLDVGEMFDYEALSKFTNTPATLLKCVIESERNVQL